ncbi:MFS transporter [Bordetella trematum]|uniref:MFS transporter n=1 Tax=Bordetella trematum TaxID=123899 RepID=UPI0013FE1E92|nr:MFS transporter [Bordetella trematum]
MSPSSCAAQRRVSRIAWVVAAVQFTNALEYMAVSPLFAWVAPDLGVPLAWAGYAAGVYTLCAIVSGLLAYLWADRHDPKRVLLLALAALTLSTFALSQVGQFATLLAWRAVAGLMGGLAMGSASGVLLMHADPGQRPALLARVIAAFSLVSIAGTPVVLWIAQQAGWRWAFGAIALACALCLAAVWGLLPASPARPAVEPLGRRLQGLRVGGLASAALNGLSQLPALLLIPLLAPLLLGLLPAGASLSWPFLVGGVAGLASARLAGRWLLRGQPVRLWRAGLTLFTLNLALTAAGVMPGAGFMACFMASTYATLVAASSVSAAWPQASQRASFSALQSALMHLVSSLAFLASPQALYLPVPAAAGYGGALLASGLAALALVWLAPRLLRAARPGDQSRQ